MGNENISPNPLEVDFFHDFMLFIKYLEKQPIKRTVTGMISLSDIKSMLTEFKNQETIKEFQHFGWSLRREEELDFLEQIKIISEMMFIIYKRKGYFHLSKHGKAFLRNLKSRDQYKEMVLHFWYKVNWGYFSRIGKVIEGQNLAEKLQQHQNMIWKTLLAKGSDWLDYKLFCQSLSDYLCLDDYFTNPYYPKGREEPDFEYELFHRNLVRFSCVELDIKPGKTKFDKEIVKFRSTDLGQYVYQKALFENYL